MGSPSSNQSSIAGSEALTDAEEGLSPGGDLARLLFDELLAQLDADQSAGDVVQLPVPRSLYEALQDLLPRLEQEHRELQALRAECSRRYRYLQLCEQHRIRIAELESQLALFPCHADRQLPPPLGSDQPAIEQLTERCRQLELNLAEAHADNAQLQGRLLAACLELERFFFMHQQSTGPAAIDASLCVSPPAESVGDTINLNRSRLLAVG